MTLGTTNAIGRKARDFALKGIDGKTYSLSHVRGPKGTLVVFICNHCPYVKASIDRVVAEAKALGEIGIGTIAIMPNDAEPIMAIVSIGSQQVTLYDADGSILRAPVSTGTSGRETPAGGGNTPRDLLAFLKPQRSRSSPARLRSNATIDSQDTIDTALARTSSQAPERYPPHIDRSSSAPKAQPSAAA